DVGVLGDLGVRLPDARGLDDDEIEAGHLTDLDRLAYVLREREVRSPRGEPPDLRFDGSTEMTAMVLSAKSARKRRTSSSTRLDLPAPPVPVMPSTGTLTAALSSSGVSVSRNSSPAAGSFSAVVIKAP